MNCKQINRLLRVNITFFTFTIPVVVPPVTAVIAGVFFIALLLVSPARFAVVASYAVRRIARHSGCSSAILVPFRLLTLLIVFAACAFPSCLLVLPRARAVATRMAPI